MRLHRRIAIIISLFGVGFLAALAVQAKVSVNYAWTFHAKSIGDNVAFSWTRYPHVASFARYEIVRTPLDGPTAPDAGDKVAVTTNRYSTNAEDHPSKSNSYWYRLCADLTSGNKMCSRPLKVAVTVPDVRANPMPVSISPTAKIIVIPATSATDPVVPILPANLGELHLTVTGSAGVAVLSWTPVSNNTGTFAEYVLVRSFATSTPSYPIDGYLAKVRKNTHTVFTDNVYVNPALIHAPRHYRICEVDTSWNVRCGNVVTISL